MKEFLSPFQEELTDFLAMRKKTVGAETYAGDCRILGSFDRFFTAYGCTEKSVSEDVVNAWIQSLFASNARKTVADKVGYLRNFLKYLQYCGVPVFIPRVPKVAESYIPYIFSEDEIERIFAAADTLPPPKGPNANVLLRVEFPMILRMLYGCGFRIGELLQVRVGDIDFERGTVLLKNAKNKKQRLVPMHSSLSSMLCQYCEAMGLAQDCDAFLFPGQLPGEHLKRDAVSHCFLTILKATGIYQESQPHTRGQCLHNLRHLFAIKSFAQAEQAGRSTENSIPYLSIFLGHYDMDGTEKYLKFSSDMFPEYTALFEDYAASVFPEVAYET